MDELRVSVTNALKAILRGSPAGVAEFEVEHPAYGRVRIRLVLKRVRQFKSRYGDVDAVEYNATYAYVIPNMGLLEVVFDEGGDVDPVSIMRAQAGWGIVVPYMRDAVRREDGSPLFQNIPSGLTKTNCEKILQFDKAVRMGTERYAMYGVG